MRIRLGTVSAVALGRRARDPTHRLQAPRQHKGSFIALLMGLTFSVFLMIQMTSMFAGMMKNASATVTNTGAKVYDPRPPTSAALFRSPTMSSTPSAASRASSPLCRCTQEERSSGS